jgi:hypothetical protein
MARKPLNVETGEISNLPAASISSRAVSTMMLGDRKFKVKGQVTRPLLKHHDNEVLAVEILSEPYWGKEIKSQQATGIATMVNVRNLDSDANAEHCYILNAVLFRWVDKDGKLVKVENAEDVKAAKAMIDAGEYKPAGELHEAFPDGLKGKMLAIHKFPKETGKRYNNFEVIELEGAEA